MLTKKIVQLILLSLLLSFSAIIIADDKVVLNIASYHSGYGWTDDCIRGIDQGLGEKYKVIHYYMDTKRLLKSEFADAIQRKAWEEYSKATA